MIDETSEAARATTTSSADASERARASRVAELLFSDDTFKTRSSLGAAIDRVPVPFPLVT